MEDKKRGRPSTKPNYWSIKDMINYAAEKDYNVKLRLNSPVLLSDGITEGQAYYRTLEKRIKKIFKDYKIAQKMDESQKTSPYILGEPIARFVVDNILKTDVLEEDLKIIIDEAWTKAKQEEVLSSISYMGPTSLEMVKRLEAVQQAIKKEYLELPDRNDCYSAYESHDPVVTLSKLCLSSDDLAPIDNAMLSAISYYFNEFKGQESKDDCAKRLALTNPHYKPLISKLEYYDLACKMSEQDD